MNTIFNFIVNFLYIFEGYVKLAFDTITGKISKRAEKRLNICNECEYNNNGVCSLCGCILKAKVRVDFLEDENGVSIDGCPEKKW